MSGGGTISRVEWEFVNQYTLPEVQIACGKATELFFYVVCCICEEELARVRVDPRLKVTSLSQTVEQVVPGYQESDFSVVANVLAQSLVGQRLGGQYRCGSCVPQGEIGVVEEVVGVR